MSFSIPGITAMAAKLMAIIAKPRIWIVLRPIRSIIAAATKYPGTAAIDRAAAGPWMASASPRNDGGGAGKRGAGIRQRL
jgi:hypothetical protein